ncbi:unnamed protein product [Closterium sp. NIES-53]
MFGCSKAEPGADSGGAGYGGAECPTCIGRAGGTGASGASAGVTGVGGAGGTGAGGASAGGTGARRQETLSPEWLHEWAARWGSPGGGSGRARAGATGAVGAGASGTGFGGAGGTGAGGASAGRIGARQQETLSPERLREWAVRWCSPGGGAGRAGTNGAGGSRTARAGGAGGTGPAGARGTGATGARRARAGGARGTGAAGAGGTEATGAGGAGAGGAGGPGGSGTMGTAPRQPFFLPAAAVVRSLAERRELESCPASPVCTVCRPRPPPVPGTHTMALRPSSVPQHVSLPSPPVSSLFYVPDPESDLASTALVTELVDFAATCRLDYFASLVTKSKSDCPPSVGGELALGSDVLEDRHFELECLATILTHLASMLLCLEGDPDALNIPTPHSKHPLSGRQPWTRRWLPRSPHAPTLRSAIGDHLLPYLLSPTQKMTTLWVLLHVATQRDYEMHSLNFSTSFLQGSLHEEIWLRRPPGFTGSFHEGTQWSLRRPVYGLRQVPREWHDTLRTTLAALGFAPSTADPSMFLRTDPSLPPFYILVYITRDIARRTITRTQSHMVHQVLQRFGFQFSSPQRTPLPTSHSLSAPPSDESIEPSGPTSGMELVLGGWGSVVFTGHFDASWADDKANQRSSPGYSFSLGFDLRWAIAALELYWLTYVLTDLGERPRSPAVLYVDNKAMIALCREQRLEHRTKHIALCYFLALELQQRGQLHLAYVASRANIADVFTKALGSGDHQHFCTSLSLVPTLPQLLVA